MPNVRFLSLFGIYLVIFIDNVGASLIIPMLVPIVQDSTLGLISVGSENFRNIIYGFALGMFSISMFFGAPLLGALSDSFGRKRTLILCLTGLMLSYLFLVFALLLKSLWLFIFGRIIGGFFSGSLPVAQASIIDIVNDNQRAKYIGHIMFFVSLGYVTGPLIGGYLSDSSIIYWFNLKTPFIFVFILSVINLLILLFVFSEKKYELSKIVLPNPIKNLISALKIKNIRIFSLLLLLMLLGWNTFFQFVGLYLINQVNLSQQEMSNFISFVGIGLSIAFLYLIGFVMKIIKPINIISLTLISMSICIGSILVAYNSIILYILALLGAICFGLCYSSLMAQLSISVDSNKQGLVMGMAGSIAAFSAGFSGLIFGFFTNISNNMPIIIASIFVFLAFIVSIFCRTGHEK